MSYFDDASLVMIPSGYKDQKVYSVKPIDGSGDLTFSRASNATRVASNGLIEKVRTNLVLQSNTFSNASWSNGGSGVVLTSGQEDPNGGTNGWRFLVASASGYLSQNSVLLTNTSMTVSVWVKSNTGVAQSFRMTANSGSQTSPFLIAGTSWTRVSWSFVSSSNGNILFPFSSSALDLLVYGFQVETGDIATDYIATTSSAVSVGPVSGLPRLDYSGGATCPSLLLEPQRTNVLTYSEDLSNAVWSKYLTTITTNNAISPSGYQDADLATSTAGGDLKNILTLSTNTAYTFSFYVKKGTAADAQYRVYNFDTATNVVPATSYISQTNTSTWVRVSVSFTSSASGTSYGIYLLEGASAGTMYFWGAQVEAGAYATSYIPTLSTAVTRVADAALKTGISSLIGQTEGTVFVEFERVPKSEDYQALFSMQGASSAQLIEAYFNSANSLIVGVYNSGAQYQTFASALTEGTYKIAVAYKENDFAFYVNGVQISTDNSGTVPATSIFNLGDFTYVAGYALSDGIKQALLFTTRLSNADLATLTTL